MDTFYVDPVLYEGSKNDKSEKASVKRAVYTLLESHEIPFMRADHSHADTIAQCEAIEKVLNAPICKNLFLSNRQATDFYLLLMPGDKPMHTADVSKILGVSRLSFAKSEYLLQYLGLAPGSVSILGLMNDTEAKVKLLIDREIASQRFICCHPCLNTSTLRIETEDIFSKFLPLTGHIPQILDIPRR